MTLFINNFPGTIITHHAMWMSLDRFSVGPTVAKILALLSQICHLINISFFLSRFTIDWNSTAVSLPSSLHDLLAPGISTVIVKCSFMNIIIYIFQFWLDLICPSLWFCLSTVIIIWTNTSSKRNGYASRCICENSAALPLRTSFYSE